MPLYEYQCEACSHRFEAIRKFSDPPLEACPKCGGKVQKQISSPAFHLKGSGWYATDYAKKPDSGKSENKSETKSETKTETKTESSSTDSASKSTSESTTTKS